MESDRHPLDARLGLNVPYEWWPGAAALKGIEAAGFGWVQVPAPPVEMLADPRHAVRHATALRRSLEVTDLDIVVHGPTNLQLGSALHYRAFEGLLEYAHHIGAELVVYHALDFDRRGTESAAEEAALRRLSHTAEALARDRLPGEPLPGVSRAGRASATTRCRSATSCSGSTPPPTGCCSTSGTPTWWRASWASRPRPSSSRCSTSCGCSTCTTTSARGSSRGEGGPSVDPLQLDLHLPPGERHDPLGPDVARPSWDTTRR